MRARARAKLTDFGIGQIVNAEALAGVTRLGFTQTMLSSTSACGTQIYLAPEILSGQPATTRSDIYSLGVVLWQNGHGRFRPAADRRLDGNDLRSAPARRHPAVRRG